MVCAVGSFKLVFYQLQIFSCGGRRAAGRDAAVAVEYKSTNTLPPACCCLQEMAEIGKMWNTNTNTNTKAQTNGPAACRKSLKLRHTSGSCWLVLRVTPPSPPIGVKIIPIFGEKIAFLHYSNWWILDDFLKFCEKFPNFMVYQRIHTSIELFQKRSLVNLLSSEPSHLIRWSISFFCKREKR